jgi:hypothetical protein
MIIYKLSMDSKKKTAQVRRFGYDSSDVFYRYNCVIGGAVKSTQT